MKRIKAYILVLAAALLSACHGLDTPHKGPYEQVLIYYALGYNNLYYQLGLDYEEIGEGILPSLSSDKAIVAYCHLSDGADYVTPTDPVLVRIYRGARGQTVMDTVKVYEGIARPASKEAVHSALEDIQQMYPSEHYGMLVSSHGTGWLPADYESYNESSYIRSRTVEPERQWPPTKALANQYSRSGSRIQVNWMEVSEFAQAIPMKLDYLILDACLMGAVEVAWLFKDVCDYLVVSPTEVMDTGMIYNTLSWDMLSGPEADLRTYCQEYFDFYDSQTGSYHSATIALVDCSALGELADAFAGIVSAHRSALVPGLIKTVQRYYYNSSPYRCFYDLRDLCVQLGASQSELATLDGALSRCVLYHAETPTFFDLPLERCCGLSVYIPEPTRPRLNAFYEQLDWNARVRLLP